jgi:hypothetical protein
MRLLEDVYEELILDEKLRRINLDPETIRKELDQQYATTGKTNKNISYKRRNNEENEVINILNALYDFDRRYENAFLKFKTNPKLLTKEIAMIDNNWKTFNQGTLQRYLKQASKLVFLNILRKMDLDIEVHTNPEGQPVYALHLLHRYIQMKILSQLLQHKLIDAATKAQIENIIFDEATRSQLGNVLKKYHGDVARTPDTSEDKNVPEETSDVEPAAYVPPTKDDRKEMIKRLAIKR